jgi:hypothetical protein
VEVRRRFSVGHDALRHTFVSMHVAKFRSMGDTPLQAGNSEAIIKKHYLSLVTPEEADAFWNNATGSINLCRSTPASLQPSA